MIADLSVNHVERHTLRCGFSVERVRGDYGLDLIVFFYDGRGHPKPGRVVLQLKATDRVAGRDRGASVACPIDLRDLRQWLDTAEPVVLVVYDAAREVAHRTYVQAHFADSRGTAERAGRTVVVRLPTANVVDDAAMRIFERFSDDVLDQQRGTIRHHE